LILKEKYGMLLWYSFFVIASIYPKVLFAIVDYPDLKLLMVQVRLCPAVIAPFATSGATAVQSPEKVAPSGISSNLCGTSTIWKGPGSNVTSRLSPFPRANEEG
jgi:hypothetical protein